MLDDLKGVVMFFILFVYCTECALSFKSISTDASSSMLRHRSMQLHTFSGLLPCQYVSTSYFSALKLWSGAWYSSLELNVNNNLTANGDFIWGSIFVGTGVQPCHWHGMSMHPALVIF